MIYRQLGNTGISVSAIALGCEGFAGKSTAEAKELMRFAIGNGVNFIDIYSSNPAMRSLIGDALQGHRDQFIVQGHICTTWENGQYLRTRDIKKTETAFHDLLNRLHSDYLDVGMIHYVDDEKDFHEVFDGQIIRYAQHLKTEGRIRAIGMSSHNPVVAKIAVETGLIDVLMFSVNPCYDLQPPSENCEDLWADSSYDRQLHNINPAREALYELCESRGVGIDVMKAYGGGDLLSGTNSPFGKALSPVQCINYALTRPAVAAVMLGCKTVDELADGLAWCNASANERDYATAIGGMKRFTWQGHCMYCGHCAPCSVGIDVASVNKFYNLCNSSGEIPETVREHYKSLSHHASECVKCGRCEKNCPFGVQIIQSMENAAKRFGY